MCQVSGAHARTCECVCLWVCVSVRACVYASNWVGGCIITGEQQPGRVFSNATPSFARICPLIVTAVRSWGFRTDEGRGRVPLYNLFRSVQCACIVNCYACVRTCSVIIYRVYEECIGFVCEWVCIFVSAYAHMLHEILCTLDDYDDGQMSIIGTLYDGCLYK